MSCRRRELTTMRKTALRRTALSWRRGGRRRVPVEAHCCAEGGHHQALVVFVCAWLKASRSWGVRLIENGSPIVKMADEECVWSLEDKVDKARVSVIAPASGPPTAAEPIVCHMIEMIFLSAEVEGVNKQALRAIL